MLIHNTNASSRLREALLGTTAGNGSAAEPDLFSEPGASTRSRAKKLTAHERNQLLAELSGRSVSHIYAARRAIRDGNEDLTVAMVLGVLSVSTVEVAVRSKGQRRPGGLRDRQAELLNLIT
jgi:hypothetical protein